MAAVEVVNSHFSHWQRLPLFEHAWQLVKAALCWILLPLGTELLVVANTAAELVELSMIVRTNLWDKLAEEQLVLLQCRRRYCW